MNDIKLFDKIIEIIRRTDQSVESYERIVGFNDWVQDKKQWDIANRVAELLPKQAKSPEDILIEKERQIEYLRIASQVKNYMDKFTWDVFTEYYCGKGDINDVTNKYNCSYRTAYRRLSIGAEKAMFAVKQLDDIDYDIIESTYVPKCQFNVVVPSFPYEREMKVPNGTYKHKGVIKHRHKCMLPEYFNDTFHDDGTSCSLCTNKWGENKCTRKKEKNGINRTNI